MVYSVISFGAWYIYKLLRDGPRSEDAEVPDNVTGNRPLAFADAPRTTTGHTAKTGAD